MLKLLWHKHILQIFFFSVLFIVAGAAIFMHVEGWSFLDALYFTVATMTTVGYGDVTPDTTVGRALAIVYMVTMVPIALVTLGVIADVMGRRKSRR